MKPFRLSIFLLAAAVYTLTKVVVLFFFCAIFLREIFEVWDVARHLVMPAVSLALFYLALYARLMRASVLEQTGMDYVTTARAKGQTERRIMTGHVLRNALLPIVTIAGVQAGNLIGGSIVVETVFGWPGIGTLAFNALQSRDLNLLLAIFFMSACLIVIINLAVDVIYVMLDPRMEI